MTVNFSLIWVGLFNKLAARSTNTVHKNTEKHVLAFGSECTKLKDIPPLPLCPQQNKKTMRMKGHQGRWNTITTWRILLYYSTHLNAEPLGVATP